MRNIISGYINHPETFLIIIITAMILMIAMPCTQIILFIKKKEKFKEKLIKYKVKYNQFDGEIICEFCKSNRVIKEIIDEIPLKVKFSFFFAQKYGCSRLMQVRCGKCSSKLFSYNEVSEDSINK